MPTSWTDKLRNGRPHQVKRVPIDIAGMKAGQVMLVPSPQLVDGFIRRLPKGRGMALPELRLAMARRHRAEVTCPITMGFQLRIVAEAAWEMHNAGAKPADLAPVWRVLDDASPTLKKLSRPAIAFMRECRRREGLPARPPDAL
ncbi:hypothetical protein [Ferrovibrio sp.]|uniref:hypothetical protein n=1 Tax=Ferrovibrio sp. TaxID=1917215 RepID=UPI00261C87DB|nr:hypothetical protein [Ferrovibrio sp.]